METKKLNWKPSINKTGTKIVIYSNLSENPKTYLEMIVDEPFRDSIEELGLELRSAGFNVNMILDNINFCTKNIQPMITITLSSPEELMSLKCIASEMKDLGVIFSNEY